MLLHQILDAACARLDVLQRLPDVVHRSAEHTREIGREMSPVAGHLPQQPGRLAEAQGVGKGPGDLIARPRSRRVGHRQVDDATAHAFTLEPVEHGRPDLLRGRRACPVVPVLRAKELVRAMPPRPAPRGHRCPSRGRVRRLRAKKPAAGRLALEAREVGELPLRNQAIDDRPIAPVNSEDEYS